MFNWLMFRCPNCGLKFTAGGECSVCGGQLVYSPYAAVPTVEEAIRLATEAQGSINDFIANLPEEIVPEERDGRFVFSSHDLIRAGFQRRLQEHDLVRAAGLIFEIMGYSYTGRIYIARAFQLAVPSTVPKEWLPKRRRKKKEEK